jgi:hypothetical protein
MKDYSKGKIYKIVSDSCDDIYIGSTIQTLSQRLTKHRNDYKQWKKGNYGYTRSFSLIERGDYHIILLEPFPCNNQEELTARERHYIDNNVCLNKVKPGRSYKEWREDNKDKIKEQNKEYYQDNKEKIREQMKEWRHDNKEKLKEQQKERYQDNKEKIKEKTKNWYQNNKDKIREYNKEYRQVNNEKIKEKKKEYMKERYQDNKEKIKEKFKRYYQENKEKRKEYLQNNKDKIRERNKSTFQCLCDGEHHNLSHKARHFKTQYHINNLKEICDIHGVNPNDL